MSEFPRTSAAAIWAMRSAFQPDKADRARLLRSLICALGEEAVYGKPRWADVGDGPTDACTAKRPS